RTYVGAMPGLILQALRRVQTKDPILMIDEIDKMSGGGPSGDPTAAMLEEHGITDKDIQFTDESLSFISNRYSREAGLRNFERNLAAIMRKRARRKAEGEEGAWIVDVEKVEEVLGIPRYAVEEAELIPEVGVATGLAWTATGGDLMVIEALRMNGSGRLTVTGQLGDVMRESVDAAYSYVRSRAAQIGIPDAAFKDYDIHVHLPAGATSSCPRPTRRTFATCRTR